LSSARALDAFFCSEVVHHFIGAIRAAHLTLIQWIYTQITTSRIDKVIKSSNISIAIDSCKFKSYEVLSSYVYRNPFGRGLLFCCDRLEPEHWSVGAISGAETAEKRVSGCGSGIAGWDSGKKGWSGIGGQRGKSRSGNGSLSDSKCSIVRSSQPVKRYAKIVSRRSLSRFMSSNFSVLYAVVLWLWLPGSFIVCPPSKLLGKVTSRSTEWSGNRPGYYVDRAERWKGLLEKCGAWAEVSPASAPVVWLEPRWAWCQHWTYIRWTVQK
jgi:hypothetical protein